MVPNPIRDEPFGGNLSAIGPVTREMVHARTQQLALAAGRIPPHVSQYDYEQAKRELTGESDQERQQAILDSILEDRRWDSVLGERRQ